MINSVRELIIFTITAILALLLMAYFVVTTLTFPPSYSQIFGIGVGILAGGMLSLYLHHYNKSNQSPGVINSRFFFIIAIGGFIGSQIVGAFLNPEQIEFMMLVIFTSVMIIVSYVVALQWRRWLRLD